MRNAILAVTAGICTALLTACGSANLSDVQDDAVAKLGKQLPAPYRDGLITDKALRQGKDIVLIVRFPEATVAMAKAKPDVFGALRRDENQAISELCQDPVLRPIYAAGGGVQRRFVDANGELFFEAKLQASDCLPN